jgi:hypothetical protein
MVIDAFAQLSAAQALTVTAFSTNTYDLGVARDLGPGEELEVCITVDTVFASGTSVNFQFVTSANANLSTPSVLIETGAIVTAQLTAGRMPIVMRVPRALVIAAPVGQRYIGLQYTIVGTYTTGAVTANIVFDAADVNKFYTANTPIL